MVITPLDLSGAMSYTKRGIVSMTRDISPLLRLHSCFRIRRLYGLKLRPSIAKHFVFFLTTNSNLTSVTL
jgi:hypothetical protein